MSSREEFLASLGLSENDIGRAPDAAPPARASPAHEPLPSSSASASAARPGAAAPKARVSSGNLWDRIRASDSVDAPLTDSPPAHPTAAAAAASAPSPDVYVPLAAFPSSTAPPTPPLPPHPQACPLPTAHASPAYGRRASSPNTNGGGGGGGGSGARSGGSPLPPPYPAYNSGSFDASSGSAAYSSVGSTASSMGGPAAAAGADRKPKAGRRAAEPALEPALQREVDRALSETDACTAATPMELKNLGNDCFQHKNFTHALRLYTAAIEKSPEDPVLYSNRSAAYLQSPMVSGAVLALKDAEMCVSLRRDWFKSWCRMGDALFKQKKHEKAVECYRRSLQLDPGNANTKASLAACEEEAGGKAAYKEYMHNQAAGSVAEERGTPGARRGPTRSDLEESAAAGRSFKEVELMRFRNRCGGGSRPGSRTASSAEHSTAEDESVSGAHVAAAYRQKLMETYRNKGAAYPDGGESLKPQSWG